jgi:hypothetical protein
VKARAVALAALLALAATAKDRIGAIDFFGYKGIDTARLRAAIPYKQGDRFAISMKTAKAVKQRVERAVKRVTGGPATDVGMVCCDKQGDWEFYIGLRGISFREIRLTPEPVGKDRLPAAALALYDGYMKEWMRTVSAGTASEDNSGGYSLSNDPALRAAQMQMRAYVLENEALVLRVLESSGDEEHRTAAAALLGYANHSKAQIAALVAATRDEGNLVRNNATRALGVMAASGGDGARDIPAGPFIEMLSSGTWTDRNKGLMVLSTLTERRGPVIERLREEALDSLFEMALWQCPDHSEPAVVLLGRMAGIDETRLMELVKTGQRKTILDAAARIRRN